MHRDPEALAEKLPTMRKMLRSLDDLREMATGLQQQLRAILPGDLEVTVEDSTAQPAVARCRVRKFPVLPSPFATRPDATRRPDNWKLDSGLSTPVIGRVRDSVFRLICATSKTRSPCWRLRRSSRRLARHPEKVSMIIATAGHIDHGKTCLVEALTGVHSDRLPEEQRRGMSIDLGFAYASLTPELAVGFVDVPGHEKFVRNMLAGVTAVDCALLVVAADDGPMPQTREHLDILDLLGIRHGVVALTKIDRVDSDRVDEVQTDIQNLLARTTLADADIIPVCAPEGIGIDELKLALSRHSGRTVPRTEDGFRLAIDRSFSLSGAGLVVTGHVFSGAINVDDTVLITPQGVEARVRGIHANDKPAERGTAGERCALNLAGAGIRREQVQRGQWVVAEGRTRPHNGWMRECMPGTAAKPLTHWTPVHFHLGTQDVTARLALLEADTIEPGESGLVRVMPNKPLAAWVGDRFIVRDQSARRTIAGGEVLDAQPPARGRAKPERLDVLR